MRKILFLMAALSITTTAQADSWDSDKNIDQAMTKAVAAFKTSGTQGLVAASQNCYAGLDTSRRNVNRGRDVEYCVALDASGSVIDNKQQEGGRDTFLSFPQMIIRTTIAVEQAELVRLPEELNRYLLARITKVHAAIPAKL